MIKSDLATKLSEVPFEAETYSLQAESRGKELKVRLDPQNSDAKKKKKEEVSRKLPQQSVKHLLFRFGMSGCFKLTPVEEIPKHAHLRFSPIRMCLLGKHQMMPSENVSSHLPQRHEMVSSWKAYF